MLPQSYSHQLQISSREVGGAGETVMPIIKNTSMCQCYVQLEATLIHAVESYAGFQLKIIVNHGKIRGKTCY
jgi:hypothetical protein